MFDILAIDWGQKRYGLSYGDSSTKLVIPDKNHRFTKNIYSDLELIFNSKPINTIVIGLPTNFQLQSTKITQVIEDFILVIKQKIFR
ncbi:MAG: pre-16S rRNA-processing nuclease YqgF [Thermales bacterium]|nr:pre-16S rRNA-processing nuclease YqgF [Thermales bacterium]